MKRKITFLFLSVITALASIFSSPSNNVLPVEASSNNQITSVLVNEVLGCEEATAFPYFKHSVLENVNVKFDTYVANRNAVKSLKSMFSEDFELKLPSNFDGSMADFFTFPDRLDEIYYSQSNVNIFKRNSSDYKLAVGFDEYTLLYLRHLSEFTGTNYTIPALYINDKLIMGFDVTSTRITAKFDNNYLVSKNINQYYDLAFHDENKYSNTGLTYFDFTLKSNLMDKITSITQISYANWITEQDRDYYYDFDLGYTLDHTGLHFGLYKDKSVFKNVSLPYDITYLDLFNGDINLGNSIELIHYGTQYHNWYLSKLIINVFTNYDANGKPLYEDVEFIKMSEDNYKNIYTNTQLNDNNKKELLENQFTYSARLPKDDEIGYGSGGLIRSYYIPYLNNKIYGNSYFKVTSICFQNKLEADIGDEGVLELSFDLTDIEAFKYRYFVDQVISIGKFEMTGVNLSDTPVFDRYYHWSMYVASLGLFAAGEFFEEQAKNRNLNIQRLYFNCLDSQNKKISNVHKIQFKYQEGVQAVNKTINNDGTINLHYYDEIEIKTKEIDASNSSEFVWNNFLHLAGTSTMVDGFVIAENDGHCINGINYQYYYQNIYHTADVDGYKAYEDFIHYWSLLSFWYKTSEGTTQRVTTNDNGLYLNIMEDGSQIVMDLNTGEESDVSVEDFLTQEVNGVVHDYEDGERNDVDQFWDDVTSRFNDFFDSIDDFFNQAGVIILSILGSVLGIGAIVLLVWFSVKVLDYAKVSKATRALKENLKTPTKKKHKRRKH